MIEVISKSILLRFRIEFLFFLIMDSFSLILFLYLKVVPQFQSLSSISDHWPINSRTLSILVHINFTSTPIPVLDSLYMYVHMYIYFICQFILFLPCYIPYCHAILYCPIVVSFFVLLFRSIFFVFDLSHFSIQLLHCTYHLHLSGSFNNISVPRF